MSTWTPLGLGDYRANYRWALVAITAMFLVLFYRFFLLQIMEGDEYHQDQAAQFKDDERIPARRGQILDRKGRVLAYNVDTHDLVMNPRRVTEPERSIEHLRRLLHLSDEQYAQLRDIVAVGLENKDRTDTIVVRRDLVSERSPDSSQKLERLDPARTTLWCNHCGRNFEQVASGERNCPHNHSHKLNWNAHKTGAVCSKDRSEFTAGTACPHDGAVLRKRTYTLLDPETSQLYNNERAKIEGRLYELPGFSVRSGTRRVYPHPLLGAHLTGYINQVNDRDLKKWPERYVPGDRVGRAGLERALEAELRGEWGVRNFILDQRTRRAPKIRRPDPSRPDTPVRDGNSIRLTIDLDLQRVVKDAMRYHRSGAAVVVHVETGEVLAMYSKPSFDPNLWSGRLSRDEYRKTTSSPYTPMLNKALTAYAPGSVYKLVTAVAALDLAKTDFREKIDCNGYKEFHNRRFHCHNRFGHGHLDLIHAMSRSCDIYFYELGERLTMDTLYEYATKYFGFGHTTGIELYERAGIVPTKEWHRKRDLRWMPGFTLSTAVGQKDVRTTPLQVARAYAAFANGGRLITMSIVKHVEDARGNVVRVTPPPRVDATLPVTPDDHAGLADSFWRVVNDEHGTSFKARMDGIEVSGKTGTAEAPERKAGVSDDIARWLQEDHAWFAGYAPSRKPEISVAVFLDHGGSGGKDAGPVAMKIFKGYFAQQERDFESGAEPGPNPITPQPNDAVDPKKINTAPIDLP